MLRTHRAGKGPGGCGGWGLGSRNRRGPGVPPTPGLRGQGTSPGNSAGFLGSSGRGKHPPLLSCSSCWGLGAPLPPTSPDHPSLLLCPQDPRGLDGVLEWGEAAWELSRLPCPSGPVDRPLLLSRSSWRVLPACLS